MRATSFVSLLLPLMLVARLKQRPANREFDPAAEFRLSALANYLLERTMNIERTMIRLGVAFPAGGSLLLVAKKPANGQ
jgi:hypothetical protein